MTALFQRLRRWRELERGQSTIEFGITFIMVIAGFLLAIQVILYLVGQVVVTNAARNGARQGSVVQNCAACAAVSAAQAALADTFLEDGSVSVKAPGGRTGALLTIEVEARVPVIVPLITEFGLDDLRVNADATFRQEGW